MRKFLLVAAGVGLLFPALSLGATIINISTDTSYTVGSETVILKAGSVYESLTVSTDSLSITVPSGEAANLHTPGQYPAMMENDGDYNVCNVLPSRDNQLIITGPKTVIIRPDAYHCDITGYDTNNTPSLAIASPHAGETVTAGHSYQIFWQNSGQMVASVRLRLSLDGGATFYQTIATNVMPENGFYSWTVPQVTTTSNAVIKIEGLSDGLVQAVSLSDPFTISGATLIVPVVTPPATTTQYNPTNATSAATTITADKDLVANVLFAPGTITCTPDTLFKAHSSASVYYCGADRRRYVFPNQKTYNTWYSDFSGVIELTDAVVAQVPIGGNVTYRPGVRLVKVQTDPKVYAVDAGGTLRWVTSEAAASRLYGSDWNQKVDDVPDVFFVNYRVGDPIE